MPRLLTTDDLKEALRATYSRHTLRLSKEYRQSNIASFLGINRGGLTYNLLERRILLYTTLADEKIYIQLPGKESANALPMPGDFRPKLRCEDGTFIKDTSFGDIWDALDGIARRHRDYLSLVATVFFRMGYMYEYLQTTDDCDCMTLQISDDGILETPHASVSINWHHLNFSEDIWYSLNNYIGHVRIFDNQTITFEAFVKFVDLLLQNEDCKYWYKNVVVNNVHDYNLANGRTSTCDANLLIIDYLKGRTCISTLLDKFQKRRGVPPFPKREYSIVTNGIVTQG